MVVGRCVGLFCSGWHFLRGFCVILLCVLGVVDVILLEGRRACVIGQCGCWSLGGPLWLSGVSGFQAVFG